MKRLKSILCSKKGVSVEMAVVFLLISAAMVAAMLSVTLIMSRNEERAFAHDTMMRELDDIADSIILCFEAGTFDASEMDDFILRYRNKYTLNEDNSLFCDENNKIVVNVYRNGQPESPVLKLVYDTVNEKIIEWSR